MKKNPLNKFTIKTIKKYKAIMLDKKLFPALVIFILSFNLKAFAVYQKDYANQNPNLSLLTNQNKINNNNSRLQQAKQNNPEEVVVTGISKKDEDFKNARRQIGEVDSSATTKQGIITNENFKSRNAFSLTEAISSTTIGLKNDTTDPVNAGSGVSIGNLPSRFTGITIDGVEVFAGGVSGSILTNIFNANAVEQIKIANGSRANNFTANGQANSLNIITSNLFADKKTLDISLQSNKANMATFLSQKLDNDNAIAVSAFVSNEKGIDTDGDGYAESAKKQIKGASLSFESRDFKSSETHFKFRQDFAEQISFGGAAYQLGSVSDLVNSDTGSGGVNFAKTTGGSANYPENEEGIFGLGEYVKNTFYMSSLQFVKDFDKLSYKLLGFFLNNDQTSYYHLRKAKGTETGLSAILAMQYRHNNAFDIEYGVGHKINTTNRKSEPYEAHQDSSGHSHNEGSINTNKNDYRFLTSFISANYEFNNLSVNGGLNYDSNAQFGKIVSPFLQTKISLGDYIEDINAIEGKSQKVAQTEVRLGYNSSYNLPSNMFDLSHALSILNTTATHANNNKPETTKSIYLHLVNRNVQAGNVSLGLVYNQIFNTSIIGVNCGSSICGHEGSVNLYNASGKGAFIKTLNIEASYSKAISPKAFVGIGAEKYSTSIDKSQLNSSYYNLPYLQNQIDYRLLANTAYSFTPRQSVFLQLSFTKPQSSDKFGIKMYNLDGTEKSSSKPGFLIADIKYDFKFVTRNRFTHEDHITLSAGINNITDFKQVKKDSFLYTLSPNGELNHGNIWGPVVGRVLFVSASVKM
jgi:hypothetical protein